MPFDINRGPAVPDHDDRRIRVNIYPFWMALNSKEVKADPDIKGALIRAFTQDKVGWSGPCKEPLLLKFVSAKPTDRLTSDYFFRLYALDSDISLGSDATKATFLQAIDGHILAAGELVGQQQRLTKHCKAGC